MKKQCYFYYNADPTKRLEVGLQWLFRTAKGSIQSPSFAFIAVNNIKDILNIPRVLHHYDDLKLLDNHYRCSIIGGNWIKVITPETIPPDGENQNMLAVYPTRRYLWSLDRIRNISVELVIPEDQYSINDWITHHKAESHGFSGRDFRLNR